VRSGWTIDDVRVVAGDYTVTGVAGSQTQPPVYNRLEANYPNPFNPETTFRFSWAAARQAEIRVYNIRGCLVVCCRWVSRNAARARCAGTPQASPAASICIACAPTALTTRAQGLLLK
jgi:hypothetical protein